MRTFSRFFAALLAATVVVSSISLVSVFAEETDPTEPSSAQEMVPVDEGTGDREDLTISPDIMEELVGTTPSGVPVIKVTRDGESTLSEVLLAGETELSEDANWYSYSISTMDELVAVLGASNVSVISDTEIKLLKDIEFPAPDIYDLGFLTGTYVIDFNGCTCRGSICLNFSGGNVTLKDSSGSNSGGIYSSPIHSDKDWAMSTFPIAMLGGDGILTVNSGRYTGFHTSVLAVEGNLTISGGIFEAYGDEFWDAISAMDVYPDMKRVDIQGGFFCSNPCAIYCWRDPFGYPDRSERPPLQISGGSFSITSTNSIFGAIAYGDQNTFVIPDMGDLIAKDCYILPGKLKESYVDYQKTSYVCTEYDIEVVKRTGVEGFVHRLYSKVLNRDPDDSGYKNWVAQLKDGKITGSKAAYGFFFSSELTKRNLSNEEFVTLLYNTFFDREPDAAGMKTWLSALENGASCKYVFAGFTNSKEWKSLCANFEIDPGSYYSDEPRDQNLKVTAFVLRLYTLCLNRKPDSTGINDWTAALNNKTQDGARVAYGFFFSQEFINRKLSNADYVEVLYKVLLGRDSDPTGKADWVKKLDDGTGRMDVFRGFVHSQEFDKICADYGIVRGTI
jgi:hypothetical protein